MVRYGAPRHNTGMNMRLKVKKYSGDEHLESLLSTEGNGISVDTVKSAMLGVQASAETAGIKRVVLDLFPKTLKLSGGLLDEMEGLWYTLYGATRMFFSDGYGVDINRPEKGALVDFIGRQIESGDRFLRYILLGRTDEFFENVRLKKLYVTFHNNLELLKGLHGSMQEKWTDKDFEDLGGLAGRINSFSRVMWDVMVGIKEQVKAIKIEKLKNLEIIKKIEDQVGQEIRRNDACPCGSGKKYKKCCGKMDIS